MLTARQIELIERSYRLVSLRLLATGERFYQILFERYPQVQSLFKADSRTQSMKLMQTIGFAVSQLHSPDMLAPVLQALGSRHIGYGVQAEHYNYVGEALIATLAEMLGPQFDEETREAWTTLYGLLVEKASQPNA